MGDPQLQVGKPDASLDDFLAQGILVPGLTIDSRKVNPGDVYIAIKGDKFDGHDFLNECVKKGAAVLIVSRTPANLNVHMAPISGIITVKDTKKALADLAGYYRQKYGSKMSVVGVCGSSGKTSVKEMTAQILGLAGPTVHSLGNYNNEIGCPLSLLRISPHHEFGVFEIGSSAVGEVKRLSAIVQPRVAIVTNILLEHTETFGTIEQIAEGESEIFSGLDSGGVAVIPRDDPHYDYLKSRVPQSCTIKSFGFSEDATVMIQDFSAWPGPLKFKLLHRDSGGKVLNSLNCTLPVIGRVNAINAAAAAAAALALGVQEYKIQQALAQYKPPGMRLQVYQLRGGITLVNDSYNANPGSMRSAIESLVESYPDRKKCLIVGDMLELGEISRKEHYELGKFIAQKPLTGVVAYGSQSRFIFDGAKDSMMNESSLSHCSDPETLFKKSESLLAPETVIFFKASRGMKLEQVIHRILEKYPAVS